MQAAVFLGREKIEVQQVPAPVCGDRELLLRVEIVGICGTDVKTYFQGARGVLKPPHIMGHEITGTVIQVGAGMQTGPLEHGSGGCNGVSTNHG
jgi:L-iditol 2-dehydrogenase